MDLIFFGWVELKNLFLFDKSNVHVPFFQLSIERTSTAEKQCAGVGAIPFSFAWKGLAISKQTLRLHCNKIHVYFLHIQ